mgnify:CR=1 FL=1
MAERHSQHILNALYEYDSFLDSLRKICDMGCGSGEDINWWATLTTRDDPPVPHNYKCYAVDRDPVKLAQIPDLPNIVKIEKDFSELCLPTEVDLIWSHDSLQYSLNPLQTLRIWNEQMNVNGMLVLTVPMHTGVENNNFYSKTYSGCYYHYTPTNLIYMLAVNGFDCKDAYLYKRFNDTWLHMAVYKSNIKPMDPATTSWVDLIDTGLLHPTVVNSILKWGYVRQEEVLYPWLDRENYFIDYVSQWTEIPPEAGPPEITGTQNIEIMSTDTTFKQADTKQVKTKLSKQVGVLRPQKKKYD